MAQEHGKLLELNNNSTTAHRPGSLPSLKRYILCCKEHRQRVCVASDAHFYTGIGDFSYAETLLQEVDFPEELILNTDPAKFLASLKRKKNKMI